MAVDWTGYKLAPDFSGLAQGIAQYGANKQASAQFQQEMDYKNRALAAAQQRAMMGGGNNQFYADVFLRKDPATGKNRYFRSGIDPQGNPIEVALPEGYEPVTAAGAFGLSNSQAIADSEALRARQVEQAKLGEQLKSKPQIEGSVTTARTLAETAAAPEKIQAEEEAKNSAAFYTQTRDLGTKALQDIKQTEKMITLARDPKTMQGTGAAFFTAASKAIGMDVANEEEFVAGAGKMVDSVLRNYSGPQTDGDALRAALLSAQQSNSREGNIRLLEEYKRFQDRAIEVAKLANQVKYEDPKKVFRKDVFENRLFELDEKKRTPQAAPQGAQPNQAQLDYEAKKKALGL